MHHYQYHDVHASNNIDSNNGDHRVVGEIIRISTAHHWKRKNTKERTDSVEG